MRVALQFNIGLHFHDWADAEPLDNQELVLTARTSPACYDQSFEPRKAVIIGSSSHFTENG